MAEDVMYMSCVLKSQFDPGALNGSYQPLNGTGFSDSAKILKIFNPSTTVSIDISLDGVNDHDFIPPSGTLIVDFQTNHADAPSFGTGTLVVRKGQILWGKLAAHASYIQIVGYR